MYCKPSAKKNKYSCFTNKQIYKICQEYNKQYNHTPINLNNKPNKLYKELCKHMIQLNPHNSKEVFWLEESFIDNLFSNKEKNDLFVPKMPEEWCKNNTVSWDTKMSSNNFRAPWLSNFDIDAVINQYHTKYPFFIHLGTFPIDFQGSTFTGSCVSHLCGFKISELTSRNKTCFGIILNTDKHNEGGSHWISIFCNLKQSKIYFFNSAENIKSRIPTEVINFVDDISNQAKKLFRTELEFIYNQKIHQQSDSECGIYSIFFILTMLEASEKNNTTTKTIFNKYFNNSIITDINMLEKRLEYFRPHSKCIY
tara:strand:+ start:528 stop:1457 length:930 start_codon:yes stop_codon:yes gene_type:complete